MQRGNRRIIPGFPLMGHARRTDWVDQWLLISMRVGLTDAVQFAIAGQMQEFAHQMRVQLVAG